MAITDISAGQLTERIQISAPNNTADGGGGATPGWSLWAGSYAAKVQPVAANEAETNGGTRQVTVALFIVRRQVAQMIQAAGGTALRIVWNDKNYDIQRIDIGPVSQAFTVISGIAGITS